MENNKPSLGLLAEYETPEGLMAAAEKVRDGGYKRWDTHTPFPIHGIDDAMGIKPTILPWIVLCAAAAGTTTALLLQWWTNGVDYPFQISGKPLFSWVPAFPVTFELTVLFAGVTTLLAMLALNRLPRLHNPLFDLDRFARATQDRFFLAIDAKDPLFNDGSAKALLAGTGADAVEDIPDMGASDTLPAWIWQVAVVLVFLSFIPLGIIVKARATVTSSPAIHLVQDMDYQYSYRTGENVPFFEDGRAMRPELVGTVAVGDLQEDDAMYRGKDKSGFIALSPLPATPELMARGQERFDIYCAPCHGDSGYGDGMVHRRAMAGAGDAGGWVSPTNITSASLQAKADGDFFNTISNGIRSMPAYGAQIPVEDRWAIVLYLRALQRATNATEADVPAANLGELNK